MPNLVDLEDVTTIDRLAMKMLEREMKRNQENKRKRRNSSADEEDMNESDGFATVELLNEIKGELLGALDKVRQKLNGAFGQMGDYEKKLKTHSVEQVASKNAFENLKIEVDELRKDSKKKMDKMQADLETKTTEIKAARTELNNLRMETDVLKSDKRKAAVRLVDLEARSRRNNLIFYGIPDTYDKDENCVEKLESFIKNELKINGNVYIQRAHRMGVPKKPVEKFRFQK